MRLDSPSSSVELSYRPELHILVVRWLGQASDDEIRRVYAHLTQINPTGCRFWLLDARRRPSSSPVITRWMLEEYAPQEAARMGGTLYFSYLISPAHLEAAEEFRQKQEQTTGRAAPYRLNYAIQEGTATEWLLQAQRLERGEAAEVQPGLEAETPVPA